MTIIIYNKYLWVYKANWMMLDLNVYYQLYENDPNSSTQKLYYDLNLTLVLSTLLILYLDHLQKLWIWLFIILISVSCTIISIFKKIIQYFYENPLYTSPFVELSKKAFIIILKISL